VVGRGGWQVGEGNDREGEQAEQAKRSFHHAIMIVWSSQTRKPERGNG
jgi:hypothetical protein